MNHIKKVYIKSNIPYENIYKPRAKTVYVSLNNIVRKIENDDKISKNFKDDFIDAYDNISNKTKLQFHNKYYRKYVMDPIKLHYIEKNIEADDKNLL